MQKIFLLLFLFSFFACQNKNKLSNNLIPKEQAITTSPSVFGKWVMCHSEFNGGGISYNVCPIIKFNALSGEYIYQSETFLYKADYALGKLQITNKTKTSSIIADGIYQMIFSKNGTELILKELRSDNKIYELYLNKASD
ncbi:MAG: hypothetical protein RI955_212 [Bacteroidota bacterium]